MPSNSSFNPSTRQPADPVLDFLAMMFTGGTEAAQGQRSKELFPSLSPQLATTTGHHAVNALVGQQMLQKLLGSRMAGNVVQNTGLGIEGLEAALTPETLNTPFGLEDTLVDFIANQLGSEVGKAGGRGGEFAGQRLNEVRPDMMALSKILAPQFAAGRGPSLPDLRHLAFIASQQGPQAALNADFGRRFGPLPPVANAPYFQAPDPATMALETIVRGQQAAPQVSMQQEPDPLAAFWQRILGQ